MKVMNSLAVHSSVARWLCCDQKWMNEMNNVCKFGDDVQLNRNRAAQLSWVESIDFSSIDNSISWWFTINLWTQICIHIPLQRLLLWSDYCGWLINNIVYNLIVVKCQRSFSIHTQSQCEMILKICLCVHILIGDNPKNNQNNVDQQAETFINWELNVK